MNRLIRFQTKAKILGVLLIMALVNQIFGFSDELELGVNANFMFNVEANFKNMGGFSTSSGPGPGPAEGGGIDRFYDDGFVRVGENGNPMGLTSFWGYENAGQVPGNDTLVLNSISSTGNFNLEDVDNSVHNGAEIFIRFPKGDGGYGGPIWGIRESISYYKIQVEESGTMTGNLVEIQDAFALDGVIPPTAPFSGSFTGPGPLINDAPTRLQENSTSIAIDGDYDLEADMISFGLGPYWDFYVQDRLQFSIDGGMQLTWIFSDFSFNEIITRDAVPTENQGSDSKSDFLFGGYIQTSVNFEINLNLAIQAGARYQLMEDFDHKENGRNAELDFSGAGILSIGLTYLF